MVFFSQWVQKLVIMNGSGGRTMATRRNFFKYLGLAGGVAGGGIVAAAAVLPDPEQAKCVEQIDKTMTNIQFQQTYGQRLPDRSSPSNYMIVQETRYVPGTRKDVAVGMNVGPDGEMYLKVNGKWRKIVTE
jgi:hypothetical protein